MAPFEIVESTADVGVRVRAADLETFFEDAARGMFHIICDEPAEGWPAAHEAAHHVSAHAPEADHAELHL